jgi:predicted amidohydrolase
MNIGFYQFKPEFGRINENIAKIYKNLTDVDFDLMVLPELASSGYFFSSKSEVEQCSEKIPGGDYCRMLTELCRDKNCFITSGVCEKSNDRFFNTAILVKPDGMIHAYRKIHLFYEEPRWFEPGNEEPPVVEIESEKFGKVKIGLMICFDWIFPETARTLALKGAQIICHPSNLVLPYCQNAMFTRALENHVFIITTNRIGTESSNGNSLTFTGESVIVDPKGNYFARASNDKEEIKVVQIDPAFALDKYVNKYNNVLSDRKPGLYKLD